MTGVHRERSEQKRRDALLRGLRQGRESAFDVLYARLFPRVYGFIQRRLGDRVEAEDLTQEVFLAILRSVDRYAGRAGFDAWVLGIARNKVREHLRSRRRRELHEQSLDPPQAPRRPDQELVEARVMEVLESEVARAEDWEGAVFVRRYLVRESVREIARDLGRSCHAVRVGAERLRSRVARRVD